MTFSTIADNWKTVLSDLPMIGHFLPLHLPERWVRIHSLPKSKRYADTEAEYQELLRRQNSALLAMLDGKLSTLIVTNPNVESLSQLTVAVQSDFVPIGSIRIGHFDPSFYDDVIWDFHAAQFRFVAGMLDCWLREVADWKQINTIFVNDSFTRFVHPYDGGMDLILADATERGAFARQFADWLSPRPDGW